MIGPTSHTHGVFPRFSNSELAQCSWTLVNGDDLNPLEFGVISEVKSVWLNFVHWGEVRWEEALQQVIRLLEEFNPSHGIKYLPGEYKHALKRRAATFDEEENCIFGHEGQQVAGPLVMSWSWSPFLFAHLISFILLLCKAL